MNLLYTEEEMNRLSRRIKRRQLITLLVSLPFFAAFILFFVMHLRVSPSNPGPIADDTLKIYAIIACIVALCILVFGLSFLVRPLRSYRNHIQTSLFGRSREATYRFLRLEPDLSVIDEITFRSLVFEGEPDKHGLCEHMYYWDALKDIPDFSEGEEVSFRFYDRFITAWSR